jgi:proline dehydrogenase
MRMKYIPIVLFFGLIQTGCYNSGNVKVPENVNTQVQVAPVTGEIIVKHIMTIELPTVFTDTCKQQHPNDEAAYNACVAKYIEELLKIINSINPGQLPVQP